MQKTTISVRLMIGVLMLVMVLSACGQGAVATTSPTAVPTPTPENTQGVVELPTASPTPEPTPSPTPEPPAPVQVSIAAIGDMMCHENTFTAAWDNSTKSFNFYKYYEFIEPYLKSADFTIGNLETNLGEGDSKGDFRGYPSFKSPDSYAQAAFDAGINVMTTANNHILDSKWDGLKRTLDKLDELGVPHTGTARTREESEKILMLEKQGMKIALLAYVYQYQVSSGSRVPSDMREYAVNFIEPDKVIADVKRAREEGADVILVSLHIGSNEKSSTEYIIKPTARYKELVQQFMSAGADAIIGHHPHVPQSFEMVTVTREDGKEYTGPVYYSLGNFLCNPSNEARTANGVMGFMSFEKDMVTGETRFLDALCMPTYILRKSPLDYRILPISYVLDNPEVYQAIGVNIESKLKSVLKDTTEILGDGAQRLTVEIPAFAQGRDGLGVLGEDLLDEQDLDDDD